MFFKAEHKICMETMTLIGAEFC